MKQSFKAGRDDNLDVAPFICPVQVFPNMSNVLPIITKKNKYPRAQ